MICVEQLLHDLYLQRNVQCFGRQAHAVVASLVAEFPGHRDRARGCVGGGLEMRHDLEISAEHGKRLFREAVFLHPGLREVKARRGERPAVPGEPEGNQVVIGRRVAIDVIAGAQLERQGGIDRGARFRNHLAGRRVVKDVALRESLCPQGRRTRQRQDDPHQQS